MQTPTAPAVALDSDYTETHGAATDSPERELWRGVLRQAGLDLSDSDPVIRQDAVNFFLELDLLDVMDMAGIDRNFAPTVRARALTICQQSGRRRGLVFQGQTRTYQEWSEVTGLTLHTIVGRLRMGWPVERALTVPIQSASGHSRKPKISVHPAESPQS